MTVVDGGKARKVIRKRIKSRRIKGIIRTHDCLKNVAEGLCEVYQLVSLRDQD